MPFTIAGVNSFDDSPYRPPITVGFTANGSEAAFSASTVTMSW
jgi:hypothetical protein